MSLSSSSLFYLDLYRYFSTLPQMDMSLFLKCLNICFSILLVVERICFSFFHMAWLLIGSPLKVIFCSLLLLSGWEEWTMEYLLALLIHQFQEQQYLKYLYLVESGPSHHHCPVTRKCINKRSYQLIIMTRKYLKFIKLD